MLRTVANSQSFPIIEEALFSDQVESTNQVNESDIEGVSVVHWNEMIISIVELLGLKSHHDSGQKGSEVF